MGQTDRFKAFKPFLIALLILALAVAIFALLKATKPKPEAQPVKNKRWPVSYITALPASYTPQIRLLGKVESPYQTQISAAVSGYITAIHALEGETLPEGETLIELDNRDSKILLQQRKADLDNQQALLASERLQHKNNLALLEQDKALLALNKASVTRLKALTRQGSAAQSTLDEAQQALIRQKMTVTNRQLSLENFSNRLQQLTAQRDKADALYQQAKLDLLRTQAKTPYSARIASLNVAPGDRVTPGKVLATLYPEDKLEVRAQIPSKQVALLNHNAQPLTAYVNYQKAQLPLNLRTLSAEVRNGQGGIDALFRFSTDKADQLQKPNLPPIGQSLALTLDLPAVDNAVALPGTAFYGQNRIYTIQNELLVSHQVERLGSITDRFDQPRILISANNLPVNSKILITQLPNAISGLAVKASPAAQTAATEELN